MSVRVHVQNYQSIHEAEIEIEGFTVVTGSNNTGKTALMRAIRGVFQNTPGTAFIREGETGCTVTVDFGDRRVTWFKGTGKKDRPTYIIDGGTPLYPGQGVPEEVAALGVTPIQAGGQEVWPTIAPQFTGQIFLLDKPGSAVAEAVADVERVGQLNRALGKSESDRRQAASALRIRLTDLEKYQAEVAGYAGLDEAVAKVADLEETRIKVLRVGKALQGLIALRTRLHAAKRQVRRLAPVADIQVPDPEALKKIQADLVVLRHLRHRQQKALDDVTKYTGVEALMVTIDEGSAKRLLTARDVLIGMRTRLVAARTRVNSLQAELQKADEDLASAMAEAEDTLKDVGLCPVCGTTVSET